MHQINKKIGRFNGVKISLGKEVGGQVKGERIKGKGERA